MAGDGDTDVAGGDGMLTDVDIEEHGRSLDGDGVVGRQQVPPVGAVCRCSCCRR